MENVGRSPIDMSQFKTLADMDNHFQYVCRYCTDQQMTFMDWYQGKLVDTFHLLHMDKRARDLLYKLGYRIIDSGHNYPL